MYSSNNPDLILSIVCKRQCLTLNPYQGSHMVLKVLWKHWIVKSVLKTFKKYWIWPKCSYSIEKVWKLQIQPFVYSNVVLYCWWQFCRCFLHCVPCIKLQKNEDKWWYGSFFIQYWKGVEIVWKMIFENVWEPCLMHIWVVCWLFCVNMQTRFIE